MTTQRRIEKGMWWDRAWSLVEGCTPVSRACRNCWSAMQTSIRSHQSNPKILARYGGLTGANGRFNGTVRPMFDSLYVPLTVRKPTTWAVWNDLFHESVPEYFIAWAWAVMGLADHHTFIVLTKRPDRMLRLLTDDKFLDLVDCHTSMTIEDERSPIGPGRGWDSESRRRDDARATAPEFAGEPWPNVVVGTSAEDQDTADERIPLLLQTPAAARAVSLEPLLGRVALRCISYGPSNRGYVNALTGSTEFPEVAGRPHAAPPLAHLDWVICGGESGHHARPMHPDWVRSVRNQCVDATVPFLFKQWGEWAPDCWCGEPGHADKTTPRPKPGTFGVMFRCGKKAAGRELDGRTWNEMPPDLGVESPVDEDDRSF